METTTFSSDILGSREESYLGQQSMKETQNADGLNRDKRIPISKIEEADLEFHAEAKEKQGEKEKQVEQNKIWELYKEKSLRSNLWRLFVESYINEYKLIQIQKSLESGGEYTMVMDLAIIWSRFVRIVILPIIGLFYWKERDTVSSLYREGLDPHVLDSHKDKSHEKVNDENEKFTIGEPK